METLTFKQGVAGTLTFNNNNNINCSFHVFKLSPSLSPAYIMHVQAISESFAQAVTGTTGTRRPAIIETLEINLGLFCLELKSCKDMRQTQRQNARSGLASRKTITAHR